MSWPSIITDKQVCAKINDDVRIQVKNKPVEDYLHIKQMYDAIDFDPPCKAGLGIAFPSLYFRSLSTTGSTNGT